MWGVEGEPQHQGGGYKSKNFEILVGGSEGTQIWEGGAQHESGASATKGV
jgi:hypothetical protein